MLRASVRAISLALVLASTSWAASELIDEVVARVGKTPLTMRDVEVNACFTRLLEDRRVPARFDLRKSHEDFSEARAELANRTLIQNYLQGTGLTFKVSDAQQKALRERVEGAFASREAMEAYLRTHRIAPEELDLWLINHQRNAQFMNQHLGLRVQIVDEEVKAYYEKEKEKRFLGKSFDSVESVVRADLKREKLRREFEAWRQTEMERTDVLLLPLAGAKPTRR